MKTLLAFLLVIGVAFAVPLDDGPIEESDTSLEESEYFKRIEELAEMLDDIDDKNMETDHDEDEEKAVVGDDDNEEPTGRPRPSGRPSRRPRPSGRPSRRPRPSGRPSRRPRPSGRPSRRPRPSGLPSRRPRPGGKKKPKLVGDDDNDFELKPEDAPEDNIQEYISDDDEMNSNDEQAYMYVPDAAYDPLK
ncbi:uncharacterized protein LOC110245318 isoform X1 [Exaiptasia diaphana]|uniref:Uncharacterized protein n=1 Tax=Exaiptasia diaphana TaxID=2652724 RepID=A0A913XMK8_EXADI|nr:uncharacterized protein LOC110245318 isoform X1 [Exaiptasia diaphana]KXJ25387.1 hypothetical protein AC249_AIPGENE6899 [Exaiptasia diaphana]